MCILMARNKNAEFIQYVCTYRILYVRVYTQENLMKILVLEIESLVVNDNSSGKCSLN